MSEVLAQLEKKGGGQEKNQIVMDYYHNGDASLLAKDVSYTVDIDGQFSYVSLGYLDDYATIYKNGTAQTKQYYINPLRFYYYDSYYFPVQKGDIIRRVVRGSGATMLREIGVVESQ